MTFLIVVYIKPFVPNHLVVQLVEHRPMYAWRNYNIIENGIVLISLRL